MDFTRSFLMMDSLIKTIHPTVGQVHGLHHKFSDDGQLIKLFTQRWGKVHGLYPEVFSWWTSQPGCAGSKYLHSPLMLRLASRCVKTESSASTESSSLNIKRLHKKKPSPNCDLTGYHGWVCKRFEQHVQVHLDIMLSERGLYFFIQRHNQS